MPRAAQPVGFGRRHGSSARHFLPDSPNGCVDIGPSRPIRGKLSPQIGGQFRDLAVGQAVLEGGHIAEVAGHGGLRCRAGSPGSDCRARRCADCCSAPAMAGCRTAARRRPRGRPRRRPGRSGRRRWRRPTCRVLVAASSLAASASCAGLIDGGLVERAEIDRHGADVLIGQCGEFLHDRRHRSGGDAVQAGLAGSQISVKLILAPGDRRLRQRCQGRRFPAFREAAGEVGALPFRAQRVARRMAGAAMAEAFDQIGAAIP